MPGPSHSLSRSLPMTAPCGMDYNYHPCTRGTKGQGYRCLPQSNSSKCWGRDLNTRLYDAITHTQKHAPNLPPLQLWVFKSNKLYSLGVQDDVRQAQGQDCGASLAQGTPIAAAAGRPRAAARPEPPGLSVFHLVFPQFQGSGSLPKHPAVCGEALGHQSSAPGP